MGVLRNILLRFKIRQIILNSPSVAIAPAYPSYVANQKTGSIEEYIINV